MATNRKVVKLTLMEGEDFKFTEIANDKNKTIIGVTDGLTKEGDVIRVVDIIEKVGGEPVYTPPIC